MLEDRPYMRQQGFEARSSVTLILVAVNIAAFIAQTLIPLRFTYEYLALSADGLRHGFVWELISFQFLHASFGHLFGNCIAIYFFGKAVEQALGARRCLILYFASGIIGGLCQALLGVFIARFGMSVVGASAGAMGLTAAFAMLFSETFILVFFILPVRARFFLWFAVAYALAGILLPRFDPGVAHIAHLGGILCGAMLIKFPQLFELQRPHISLPWASENGREFSEPSEGQKSAWDKARRAEATPDEFLSKEVDPILDKISAQGIQSLTEREREILERARSRMKR